MFLLLALLALAFLVFIHELGHFLVAKFFGVHVLEFAVGFGPVVFGKTVGETFYSIRGIPLGGFVRMAGDTPEEVEVLEKGDSATALQKEESEKEGEDEAYTIKPNAGGILPTEDKNRWFLAQPYWPKFWIVFAGPFFNFASAFLMAAGLVFFLGKAELLESAHIGAVFPDMPAFEAGLKEHDLVTAIDGIEVSSWKQLSETIKSSKGKALLFDVMREDGAVQLEITPTEEKNELDQIMGDAQESFYKIGIMPDSKKIPVEGISEAVSIGFGQVYFISELTVKGIWGMVAGKVSSKNVAGPIFIFQQGSEAAKSGLDRLIDFMVFLSVSLGLLNLLPIPILDGGHLVFFTIEALKGSPVSEAVQQRAMQFGMIALCLLMLLGIGNDITRLFG